MNNVGNKPLAIVMGRNYTTRLTLVRAAGMAGCDVAVIRTSVGSMFFKPVDEKSKYVVETRTISENDNDLIENILSFKRENEKVLLLPADDYTAGTIDMHLNDLEIDFVLPHVNHSQGAVVRLMDKSFQKDLARKVGLNVAKGWIADYVGGKYVIPNDIVFPCFVKPNESLKGHWKNLMRKCDNIDELQDSLSAYAEVYHAQVLIEEFREIDNEYGVQGVSFDSHAVIPSIICKSECREGLTATGNLLPIDGFPELRDKLREFLVQIHFTGVFDMDLYVSNGKWFFNELNVRLGANGFALTYGVYNVPGIFIRYMINGEEPSFVCPRDFKPISFASENVLRNMYFDRMISHKQYKDYLRSADVLSIPFQGDNEPWKEFQKTEWFLPLYMCMKAAKKVLYYNLLAYLRQFKSKKNVDC